MNTIRKSSIFKRFTACLMVALMCVSMVPTSVFAVNKETDTITGITEPDPAEYTVDYGTAKEDIGLPGTLETEITTAAAEEGGEPTVTTETPEVTWEGDYDGNTAGDYTLTAAFTDSAYTYEAMPSVKVTVNAASVEEPTGTPAEEPAATPAEEPAATPTEVPAVESTEESTENTVATLAAGTDYVDGQNGAKISITNLKADPNTGVWSGQPITVDFDYRIGFTNANWFKNGDTFTIPTNAAELLNVKGGWSYDIYSATDPNTVIAKLSAYTDKFVITFNENAEIQKLTNLTGKYSNLHEQPTAKNLGFTVDTAKTLTIGDASTDITFSGGRKLNVSQTGAGTAKLENGGTSVIMTNGETVVAVGTPYNSNYKLVSVVLHKADGTSETLTATDGKVNISYDDLTDGTNTVIFNYSPEFHMNEWRWDGKAIWGAEKPDGSGLATSIRFNIEFNYQALLGLYMSEGANLKHFGTDNISKNVFIEDTLPGGGTFSGNKNGTSKPHVYAHLANYTEPIVDANGNTVRFPGQIQEGGFLARTDLIASGDLAEITQSGGESIDTFRARVQGQALSWGIYKDASTGLNTFMVNLGSPGDPAGPAVKAQDIWPTYLARDPLLDTINGAGNCVGGNVQCFRIDYYGTYNNNQYTMENLTNTVNITKNGKTAAHTSSTYTVPGDKNINVPGTGWLQIHKYDSATNAPISGAEFKVQQKQADGTWADYSDAAGVPVTGITDDLGIVDLGIMSSGEYRAIETAAPTPYMAESIVFQKMGGGDITSDGCFTVVDGATEGHVAKATNRKAYDVIFKDPAKGGRVEGDADKLAQKVYEGEYVVAGAVAAMDNGYTFAGWSYETTLSDGTVKKGIVADYTTIVITGNTTITPKFTQEPFDVTFTSPAKGGTADGDADKLAQKVYEGDSAVAGVTATPENPEYIFTGWSYTTTLPDGTTQTGVVTDYTTHAITGDTVFTPKFAHTPFVNIQTPGGGVVKVAEGTTVPAVGTATDDTYEWDKNHVGDYNAAASFETAEHYKLAKITVTLPNQGNTPIDIDLTSGVKTITGFTGTATLDLAADGKSGSFKLENVNTSVIITVTYEKIKYQVTFDTNGGEPATIPAQTVNSGELATRFAAPTKEDHGFVYWYYVNADGDEVRWAFTSPITGDLDLIAKWRAITPASLKLNATKTLTGGGKTSADIKAGQFGFTVKRLDHNALAVTGVPTGDVYTADGGALDFGTWIFTKEGNYVFEISENTPPVGYTQAPSQRIFVRVIYDQVKYEMQIIYISIMGSGGKDPVFENVYTAPDPVEAALEGTKTLTENGKDKAMTAGQFTFSAAADTANDTTGYTGFTAGDVDVAADGTFSFGDISFTKAGIYKFTVTEQNKGAAGYIYDTKPVTVTMTVTLDETDNTLHVATAYEKDGAEATGITFENTYATPSAGEVTFAGNKHLTGGEKTDASITKGQFSFSVAEDDANDKTGYTGFTAGSVDAAAGGAFGFDKITFTKAGTYSFDITEDDKGAAGYAYDSNHITATVTVTLDAATNTLVAETAYTDGDGNKIDAIAFNNTYTAPAEVEIPVTGSKTLEGDKTTEDITEGQFTFNVAADENNNTSGYTGIEGTANVSAGGEIDFGTLSFTKVGTYKFTITENNLAKAGYTYDDANYDVTVEVTLDTATNKLKTEMAISKNGEAADAIVFANKYETKPVTVDPPVEKKITGDTPSADETFTFQMKAADSAFPMPEGSENGVKTASVKGAGKVEFGEYTYMKPGTYSYTISEVAGTNKEYTYDKTAYTLTDVVTDVDGTLTVERTITDGDGKAAESAVFTNVYTKPAVDKPTTTTKPGTTTTTKPGTTTTTGGKTNVVNKVINNVKTGDPASITFLVILLLAAGGVIIVTLRRRKVKK